ncbi:kinase-like domain-containing protein [Dipodascopsis uninucleata]
MTGLKHKVSRPILRRKSTSSLSGSDHEMTTDAPVSDHILDITLPLEQFKREILILTHHLGITRWRSIPISEYSQIKIERISGALTNAVFCVSPPPKYQFHQLKQEAPTGPNLDNYNTSTTPVRRVFYVPQLLLRIYGPNASQIIDRKKELIVLKRLTSRNIGPKLLGIFANGRFEQFLKAHTLTKQDIRSTELSKAIAKRMRELHDGMDLTLEERDAGPGVWQNIDKWRADAHNVLKLLDQINSQDKSKKGNRTTEGILHSTWEEFAEMMDMYREWLEFQMKGSEQIKKELVFAHNDAQYGNLLRVDPPSGSPLLIPANEHKQIVVIDFEYASPNVRGYDIANHFCEWMSDYHDPYRPQDIHTENFPTKTEQLQFIENYVTHACDSFEDEETINSEIEKIYSQSEIWRPAVHLGWCLWGLVSAPTPQLKVKEDDEFIDVSDPEYSSSDDNSSSSSKSLRPANKASIREKPEESLDGDPFDYIDYAAQKAALFWGEVELLGLPVPSGVSFSHALHVGKKREYIIQG